MPLRSLSVAALLLGFTASSLRAQDTTPAGVRVYVAGHSFHVSMAKPLEEIAESAGVKNHEAVGMLFVGGSRVIAVWDKDGEKNRARIALKAGKVDVLTLSPHRDVPDPGIDKFVALALEGNPKVRVLVQKSWLPYDASDAKDLDPKKPLDRESMTLEKLIAIHKPFITATDDQLKAVNEKLGKTVVYAVPTGPALFALREKIRLGKVPGVKTQSALFVDRMGHIGPIATVMNAYCHYAVIYGKSPVGLLVPGLLEAVPEAERKGLNAVLQETAWDAVIAEPLSGVKAAK